jgi:uncharacterized protein
MIHVAITRKVKPGQEQAYEEAVRDFFRESLLEEGTAGVHLMRPVDLKSSNTFGILRSFENEEAREAFYRSERFLRWQQIVAPMTEMEEEKKVTASLETFFQNSGETSPNRWKMAFVTWLGVNACVPFFSWSTSFLAPHLPFWVNLLLVNALVVIALTWPVLPVLGSLFKPWLKQ